MTEHRLANILRAIADGKVVQYQVLTGGAWTDFKPDIYALPTYNLDLAWRVKPEEVVDYTVVSDSGTPGAYFHSSPALSEEFYAKQTICGFLKRTRIDGKVVSLEFIPK